MQRKAKTRIFKKTLGITGSPVFSENIDCFVNIVNSIDFLCSEDPFKRLVKRLFKQLFQLRSWMLYYNNLWLYRSARVTDRSFTKHLSHIFVFPNFLNPLLSYCLMVFPDWPVFLQRPYRII